VTDEAPRLDHDRLARRASEMAEAADRTGGRVTIEHVPFLAQVSLRLDAALAGSASLPLPTVPNTVLETTDRAVLWLGPDEWLVLGPPHAGGEIVAELEASLGGVHRSVIDVSANRVAIELGGPGRFELLASGSAIDLHPRSWHAGMCAQSLFARTQVVLHERGDTTGVLVRPSFADYLIDRLLVALP
jgi:sarcosine oxidase subunit gamma